MPGSSGRDWAPAAPTLPRTRSYGLAGGGRDGRRAADVPWWRSAVVYQIYPRSFADADGDGVGDLEGIRAELDHVAGLGVDAIWLSPIYRSPMADFGYDVSDHCDVDPVFGDLATSIVCSWRHTGAGSGSCSTGCPTTQLRSHPWFLESRSSRDSPKRDWYVWRDGLGDEPPNNWRSAFGGPGVDAGTRRRGSGTSTSSCPSSPTSTGRTPRSSRRMHDVLRFWLDRGVDGFRADVVHLIGKDPELPDRAARARRTSTSSASTTHPRRTSSCAASGACSTATRATGRWSARCSSVARAARALLRARRRAAPGLQLRAAARAVGRRARGASAIARSRGGARAARRLARAGCSRNHDEPRQRTRYGGSEARARGRPRSCC